MHVQAHCIQVHCACADGGFEMRNSEARLLWFSNKHKDWDISNGTWPDEVKLVSQSCPGQPLHAVHAAVEVSWLSATVSNMPADPSDAPYRSWTFCCMGAKAAGTCGQNSCRATSGSLRQSSARTPMPRWETSNLCTRLPLPAISACALHHSASELLPPPATDRLRTGGCPVAVHSQAQGGSNARPRRWVICRL